MGAIRRGKVAILISATRLKTIQVLMCVIFIYMLLIGLEIPLVFRAGLASFSGDGLGRIIDGAFIKPFDIQSEEGTLVSHRVSERRMGELKLLSGLAFDGGAIGEEGGLFSELEKTAKRAWSSGKKLWDELEAGKVEISKKAINHTVSCPDSVSLSEKDFRKKGKMMVIPCGLTIGSHIAIVGKPLLAHVEHEPKISHRRKEDEETVLVSQFVMELQGLNTVDGEEAPKILHFNPRLKGDWSEKAVIEHNTCFRMQWGTPLRCEGWKSKADEETVDGQVKCEKWIRDDDNHSEESKITWWLSRLIGKTKKITVDWPYPFTEEKLFVLTLSAGLEGYHINIDGKHVTSFPYRTGFVLEDATGLSINGDVDVHTVIAASLPSSHPRFAPEELLEMLSKWQAPPLPQGQVELFIGVLSAGNHFLERMAMRKSWMQHKLVKSSNVVTRFFVALHGRNKVNIELKKEAEYFGDIVIVPYMDNYELVVLKTVAICEYGVRAINAKYVMKCDDDTFVRIDAILDQSRRFYWGKSVYMGNINYHHKPLRYGKWAVTYEEWPEEDYPPYANGPGYLLSADIARFIVSLFENHKLRLFKMEDVSMGMWVEQFNGSKRVAYVHSLKFCQFGCIGGYYTAHYQSPRQMMCLWDKLQRQGRALCCDARR